VYVKYFATAEACCFTRRNKTLTQQEQKYFTISMAAESCLNFACKCILCWRQWNDLNR